MQRRSKPFKLQTLVLGWRQFGLWLTIWRTRTEHGAILASELVTEPGSDYRLVYQGQTKMTWWAK